MNHEIYEAHEKAETLTDIVAEMRGNKGFPVPYAPSGRNGVWTADLVEYADRIEAAWKRERAETEANALAVGGVVEASRNKPSGDAAALREALVGLIDGICFHCDLSGDCKGAPCEKMQKAKAALAAPPRNCDRDLSDRQSIFAEFRQWVHASSLGCVSEPSASDAFRWLLALAVEWKGESNEQK